MADMDPASQQTLLDARQQARDSLRGDLPDAMIDRTAAPTTGVSVSQSGALPEGPGYTTTNEDPSDSAVPIQAVHQPVMSDQNFGADSAQQNTVGGSIGRATKQLGSEVGNGLMRAAVLTAKGLGFAASGLNNLLSDDSKESQQNTRDVDDAIFNFIRDHVDSAYGFWQADKTNTNPYAQVAGKVTEGAAPMILGPEMGAVGIINNAAMNTGAESIDRGDTVKTATTLALVNATAAAAMLKVGSKDPNVVRRIAKFVGAGEAIDAGTEAVTRWLLNNQDYQRAVEKYKAEGANPDRLPKPGIPGVDTQYMDADRGDADVSAGQFTASQAAQTGLMQVIFALLHTPEATKIMNDHPPKGTKTGEPGPSAAPPGEPAPTAQPVEPEPNLIPGTPGEEPPPPGPAPAQVPNAAPKQVSPVGDNPSAEPVADLKAQVADMKDPATARQAVYLSSDNMKSLGADGVKEVVDGATVIKNFDGKGGSLIVPDAKARLAAVKLKKSEPDMQKVLGQLTGAGDGKQPTDTAVVQGQTPEGAVATEGMVSPAEVPGAVAQVQAEGKVPVVTTPAEAVARRARQVAVEGEAARRDAMTDEEARAYAEANKIHTGPETAEELQARYNAEADARGKIAGSRESPATPTAAEPLAGEPSKEGSDSATAEPPKAPAPSTRKMVYINGEATPVIVAGESKGGKTPVRLVDEDGRASKDIQNVPDHMFEKPQAKPPVAEPVKPADVVEPAKAVEETPEAKTAREQLAESVNKDLGGQLEKALEVHEQSQTQGTGGPRTPLRERAMATSELARAIEATAKTGEYSDQVRQDALATAKSASKFDLKSDEAITKGRGISHGNLDIMDNELKRVARNLIGKEAPAVREKPVAIKAAKLKAKVQNAVSKEKAASESRTAKEPAKAADGKGEPKVSSGIRDVEDATRPKSRQLTKGEELRVARAAERYRSAGDRAVSEAHDALESTLHEIYGEHRSAEVENIMQLMRESRNDAMEEQSERGRPRKMSDDITEKSWETSEHEGEDEHEEDNYDKGGPPTRGSPEWTQFHNSLEKMWGMFKIHSDSGQGFTAQAVLDHMLKVAPEGPIAGLVRQLRANVDARTRIMPVSGIKGEPTARGMYRTKSGNVELKAVAGEIRPENTRTLLHELVHAVTSRFMYNNPDHPLTQEMGRLLDVARERASRLVDEARANGQLIYGMRSGEGNLDLPRHGDFYGLQNIYELAAETKVNPDFQRLIDRSERVKGFYEGLRDVVSRMTQAVAKMLGLKSDSKSLLSNLMDTTDRIINAQHETGHINEPSDLKLLDEEPPAVPHEDEFRSTVGDTATGAARLFRRAVRSGAVETVRQNVRAFVTHSQLVRAALRRGVFGADNETNPLRQYDEALQRRDTIINKQAHEAEKIVNDRAKLSYKDNVKLGQFQIDSQLYGIDPRKAKAEHSVAVQSDKKFDQRYQDFTDRWNNLTDQQKDIFNREAEYNEKSMRANRKAAVNVALDAYSETDVPKAVRQLLYSVTQPHEFDQLIGTGKDAVMSLGKDRDEKLIETLKDLAGQHELEGTYFHLGRAGDYVVHATPEGTRQYKSEADARAFAARVESLSPNSRAKVDHVGDSWQVDYKADWVSMHETPNDAQDEIDKLRAQGFDVGPATMKISSSKDATLTSGTSNLLAEATRRLERNGADQAAKDAVDSLRQSFVQLLAGRSAYAASKLARKNVGGVKPEEMGRNFAKHAQSMAWNTGHMSTTFDIGEKLGRLREQTKTPEQSQDSALARGRVYDELSRRLAQEHAQFGQKIPFNATMAKIGFLNYMTSLSHSMIYLTQNFSTAIPVAMARYGGWRSTSAFAAAMSHIASPSFRETYRSLGFKQDADKMLQGIMEGVRKSERFGKWAKGENSPLQQLIDRGAIHVSLSNQLAETSKGGSSNVNRVMEYARILPSMADMFNRVSTGLAALELTKGDIYKAGDFIKETHMDYSQGEKPRAFKAVSKIWGGNSVTMFRTYTQGMAHLLYSHIIDGVGGLQPEGRAQALKTVAGVMLGATVFAGAQKGMGLEPIRAAMWAYNKLAGDSDEYYSFDAMSKKWIHDALGEGDLADMINHGMLANHITNVDLSSRMGLSDLFFHDPPDISRLDDSAFGKIAGGILGPGFQQLQDNYRTMNNAFTTGRMADFAKAIPVKIVRDAVNAYQAGTSGKMTAAGANVTDPSVQAAVTNALGFKTNTESKVQENASTDYDYNEWARGRQQDFIKRYVAAEPENRAQIWADARNFSLNNPSYRVTMQDMLKKMRSIRNTEATAAGQPGKDPVKNRLNDH